nr:hypothetical protein [Tanacetum cinerariifolium]
LGCVFELGEGGNGEGESWVSGEMGCKVGRWWEKCWRENQFGSATVPHLKHGRDEVLFGFLHS